MILRLLTQAEPLYKVICDLVESQRLWTVRACYHCRPSRIGVAADLWVQRNVAEEADAFLFALASGACVTSAGRAYTLKRERGRPSKPKMSCVWPQFVQTNVLMFCTIPRIGTPTLLKRSTPRTASRRARSCGVDTMTAPSGCEYIEN